ncbi:MAG TPA: Ig-like domain-containing protein, partial [Acidimicrobiales bacterium]
DIETTGTVGSVTLVDGVVTYNPNGQFNSLAVGEQGTDTFTYTVSDGTDTDTATVTITIEGANDQPNADADAQSFSEDGPSAVIDVLANDEDPDTTDVLEVSAIGTTGTVGTATITAGDGSVTYNPNGQFEHLNAGQTAETTFTYTVSDGEGGTDTATVTITINGVNDAPIAVADSFTGANGAIGNTKFAVGLTVTGEPVVNVTGNLLTNDTDVDNTHASLTAAFNSAPVGAQVTVNSNGTFTYVAPPGFEGNGVSAGTFTYKVIDPGGAFTVATVSIDVEDVVWYVNSSAAAGGNGTSTLPYQGVGPLSAGGELDEPNDYVFIYTGTGAAYGGGLPLEANQRLYGQPFGLVVQTKTLVSPGGTNPNIGNAGGAGITLADGVVIERVNVNGTAGDGITGGTSVNTATIGTNTVVNNTSGAAFKLNGGSGPVSMGATITNSAGRSVDIQNRTGGTVTISQLVTGTGSSGGIFLNANSGTSRTDFAGMVLSTGPNPGFHAVNAGTVTVGGANNTITTTTGVALRIENTTIASGNVLFDSISSNGAASGIILENTGNVGGLQVTGTGSNLAGSGGTIVNSTNDGIRLGSTRNTVLQWMNVTTSATGTASAEAVCGLATAGNCASGIDLHTATNITLHRMNVVGSTEQGITAHATNGLTLTNSLVDNIGNENEEFGLLMSQLSGTVLIQDTTIEDIYETAFRLDNSSGTLALTLRRVTMQRNLDTDGGLGEAGFQAFFDGGTATILIDDCVFTELERDGIDIQAANDLALGTSATVNVTIKDSDVTEGEGLGIDLVASNTATMRSTVNNNVLRDLRSHAVNVFGNNTSQVFSTITNNVISHPSPPKPNIGMGIRAAQSKDGDMTVDIQNNQVSGQADEGILVIGAEASNQGPGDVGTQHAEVRNNTVGMPSSSAGATGILIQAATPENHVCFLITGNNATGKNVSGQAGIITWQDSGVMNIEGPSPTGPKTEAEVSNYLNANNTSTPLAFAFGSHTAVAAGTCRQITTATPLP